jgi:hypothetical protein
MAKPMALLPLTTAHVQYGNQHLNQSHPARPWSYSIVQARLAAQLNGFHDLKAEDFANERDHYEHILHLDCRSLS